MFNAGIRLGILEEIHRSSKIFKHRGGADVLLYVQGEVGMVGVVGLTPIQELQFHIEAMYHRESFYYQLIVVQ
jgi:hypothetical protein